MKPFPWADAMRFGFGVLRLSPAAFWSLTPRELARAFEALAGHQASPPERGALDRLMAAFPDTESKGG